MQIMESLLAYWFSFPKALFYHLDHQSILVFYSNLLIYLNMKLWFFKIQNLFCPALLRFHILMESVYAVLYFPCKKCLLFSDSFIHLSVLQYQTFSGLPKVVCCIVFSLVEFFCSFLHLAIFFTLDSNTFY